MTAVSRILVNHPLCPFSLFPYLVNLIPESFCCVSLLMIPFGPELVTLGGFDVQIIVGIDDAVILGRFCKTANCPKVSFLQGIIHMSGVSFIEPIVGKVSFIPFVTKVGLVGVLIRFPKSFDIAIYSAILRTKAGMRRIKYYFVSI